MDYQETLKQAGLTEAQAEVYEALLRHGEQTAGSLTKKTSLKRGLVYKVLEELVQLGLAGKTEEPGEVARFIPKHPTTLRELVDRRAKALKDIELVLDGLMPSLVSEFNLISGHPGVLVYEGREGVERVINDSLSSKTEIYTYADIESVTKYIDAINKKYVAKRDRLGIHKKALLLDTPFARKYMQDYHRLVTDVRLVGLQDVPPFQSIMEIYDGKIAYATFAPERMTGVIIEDPYLYAMHKYLFECLWERAGSYGEESGIMNQESLRRPAQRDSGGQVRLDKSDIEDKKIGGETNTAEKKKNSGTQAVPPRVDEPVGEDEYFTRL